MEWNGMEQGSDLTGSNLRLYVLPSQQLQENSSNWRVFCSVVKMPVIYADCSSVNRRCIGYSYLEWPYSQCILLLKMT